MENTIDIDEKPKKTSAQVDEKPKETYRVLEFIKKHTSTFVAILSGIVAVAAFVLNLVAYVYQRIRFNPWHIGGEVIDYWENRQVYLILVTSALYFVFIYGLSALFSYSFLYYYRTRAVLQYQKELAKEFRKMIQDVQEEINRYESTHPEECGELVKRSNELGEKLMHLEKKCFRIRRSALLRIGIMCILMSILVVPITALELGITGVIKLSTLMVLWIMASITIILAAHTEAIQLDNACTPRAVRKNIQNIIKNCDDTFLSLDQENDKATKRFEQTTFKQTVNDRTIRETCVKILFGTTVMALLCLLFGKADAYKQKDFWIYTDVTQTYVMAYQDGDHCVLKKATLNGDEIIIHTGEQLVVSGTVATSQKTFDKVTFAE